MLTQYDYFDTAVGKIEDFTIKNPTRTWAKTRQTIEQRARDKGANIALLDPKGNYNRGYTAHVSLFYADSSRLKELLSAGNCFIVIFRDNGPSLATYGFDVRVNDRTYKKFSDLEFIRKQIDCNGPANVEINGRQGTIQMQGHSRYFRLIHDGRGNKHGIGEITGEVVRFGGVSLREIKDEQLGHLLSGAQTEHLLAP